MSTAARATTATKTAPTKSTQSNIVPFHKRYHLTEGGNADRFEDQHGQDVCYCSAYGWMVYKDGKWQFNCSHLVERRVQETIRGMYREAAQMLSEANKIEDEEDRKERVAEATRLAKWAHKSDTAHMTKAVLELARPRLTVMADQFDRDPWLLNVRNGTLDLRTGELRPHRREDHLMKQCAAVFDPNAPAPTFEHFIDQVTCGDKELAVYLQQVLGYSLTGSTAEQKWFLPSGGGQNGKSTLMHAIQAVMSDYAVEMAPDSITVANISRSGADATPDMARLAGARFVVASETEQGARLKSAQIKRMTGGDPIIARNLFCSPFQFVPEFKFFLDTNHLPQVRETTFAFWRRVQVIPFNHTVRRDQVDRNLEKKLRTEGAGILAWMIRGLQAYQQAEHLPPCHAVDIATGKYQDEQDILSTFLREQCVPDDKAEQPAQELYDSFKEWVEQQMGERCMAQRSFAQAMEEMKYQRKRKNAGYVWLGVRLRQVGDPLPTDPRPPSRPDAEPTPEADVADVTNAADAPATTTPTTATPAAPRYGRVTFNAEAAALLDGLPEPLPLLPAWRDAAAVHVAAGCPDMYVAPPNKSAVKLAGKPLFDALGRLTQHPETAEYAYEKVRSIADRKEAMA